MVCVLLPAIMLLMGERTWWLPRWLDRILPKLALEGEAEAEPQGAPTGVACEDTGGDTTVS
jgi:RND superfamily putative drug exporter